MSTAGDLGSDFRSWNRTGLALKHFRVSEDTLPLPFTFDYNPIRQQLLQFSNTVQLHFFLYWFLPERPPPLFPSNSTLLWSYGRDSTFNGSGGLESIPLTPSLEKFFSPVRVTERGH